MQMKKSGPPAGAAPGRRRWAAALPAAGGHGPC
jgi:hypothetical protein